MERTELELGQIEWANARDKMDRETARRILAEFDNEIPDHAHTDYGQACRHGCYGYCGTCN